MTGLNVLVVERAPSVTAELSQALAEIGHQVCAVAKDLSEVAQVLERLTPDVIALGMDLSEGNEALGLATVLEATGPLPIVFVADTVDEPDRNQIRAIECTALLVRPFGAHELRFALALAVERARAAREGETAVLPEQTPRT